MLTKTRYVDSRSFKVIEFGANRKGICNLLQVVNSNLGRISYGFSVTVTCWSKVASGADPCLHITPALIPSRHVDEPFTVKD